MTSLHAQLLQREITQSGYEVEVIIKPGHKMIGSDVWVVVSFIDPDLYQYLHGLYQERDLLFWSIHPYDGKVAFVLQ